jgi:DNA end-binding protein Ku
VKDAELKLAKQLIDAQTSETFDPSQYKDEVAARIESAVQRKIEGQEITTTEAPETTAQVIDLMEALRASLEKKPAKKLPAKDTAKVAAAPARKPPKRVEPAETATTRKRAKG